MVQLRVGCSLGSHHRRHSRRHCCRRHCVLLATARQQYLQLRGSSVNGGFGAGVRCIGPFFGGGGRQGACLSLEQTFLATAAERPY